MSYTGDAMEEYPFQVDGQIKNTDDGATITFMCESSNDGVISPPTRAEWHVDNWVKNTQYDTRVNIHRRNIATDPHVKSALGLGYIIQLPSTIGVIENETPPDGHGTRVSAMSGLGQKECIHEFVPPEETGLQYPTQKLDTQWMVDVPDGYSLLITTPFFIKADTYSVVPTIIDADIDKTPLEVTMLLHDSDLQIQYADPIIQVIPFKRDVLRTDAIIDRSVEE